VLEKTQTDDDGWLVNMKDAQALAVTARGDEQVKVINQVADILFNKIDGIDKLLPIEADKHTDCAMLQFYTAIMFFFSFSEKVVNKELGKYLARVDYQKINEREKQYFIALNALAKCDFEVASQQFKAITEYYPQDRVALLMCETCGFLSGKIEWLEDTYKMLWQFYSHDPKR